jgi:hypothetical protein
MSFGRKGTPEAVASEYVYRQMISPVLRDFSYNPIRGDEIPHPGSITRQILDLLQHSHLVVADLTKANPNVYYELGVRHSFVRTGTILMAQDDVDLPFDVANYRVLFYSTANLAAFAASFAQRLQIIEERVAGSDNPVHDFPIENERHDAQSENCLHCGCQQEVRRLRESMTKVIARISRASECKLALHISHNIFDIVDAPDAPFNDAIRDVRLHLAVREGFILPPIDVVEDRSLKPGCVVLRRGDEELLSARYANADAFVEASPETSAIAAARQLMHPLIGTPLMRIKRSSIGYAVANGGNIIPTSHIVAAEVGRVCLKVRTRLEVRHERR